MKFYNVSLLLFFLSIPIFAQAQDAFEISGKVVDESNQEPVPFAQVAVYKEGETAPISGTVTRDNGEFQLKLKRGDYKVEVVFVGYDGKKIDNLKVDANKSIGSISLSPSSLQLDEIVVKGNEVRRAVTTTVEGINVRPDQTLSNAGGSVLDVLRNTPSVNVSQDGAISLRGSGNTNILLDGRNSNLVSDLEQLPASMIESIQIVNNPNAKYDAQGAGGVINIKLKRGEQTGTSGKAELTMGSRMRSNASIRLSRKSKKLNVYGGYSYRSLPGVGFSNTERRIDQADERLLQNVDRNRNDKEHTFSFGGDYFFGKNKISYEGAFSAEDENDFDDTRTSLSSLATGNPILSYRRENNETEDNISLDNALIYERMFDRKGQEFRALISHSFRDGVEAQFIDIYDNLEIEDVSRFERSSNDQYGDNLVMQADYVHPLANGKIETGYKSIFRTIDNDFLYEAQNGANSEWTTRDDVSNRFRYEDQIFAAYLIYSGSLGEKLSYSAGVRGEQTFIDTRLFNNNEVNEQSYLNFFPSASMQYKASDNHTVKFSYSRRIDRPRPWRLNPFPDISDSLNVRIGNPNLQPEFINSFEVGHLFSSDKVELTTNFFYRNVNGQIDWIVRVEDGISYRGPLNLNNSQTYGFEIVNVTQLTDWWSINASYSLFETRVDGTNLNSDFNNNGLSWYVKLNSDFSLPWGVDMQITANYTAPEIEAQGRDLARYFMDLSFQKSFLNDKMNATLSIRDIFDTLNFQGENFGQGFFQDFEFKRETRIALLSLNYAF